MKKIVRITESELVNLIRESISENELNEQLPGLLKRLMGSAVQPSVKKAASQIFADYAKMSPAINTLLRKIPNLRMTSFVAERLRPVTQELNILTNDMRRLYNDPKINQQVLYNSEIGSNIKKSLDIMNTPVGQTINMNHAWGSIKNIEDAIGKVTDKTLKAKLTPLLQNTKDAMREIEKAISSIAIK